MERFTSKKPQAAQQQAAANTETFSEMASATAERSGVIGKLLVVSLIIVSIAITAFVGFAIVQGVSGDDIVKEDQYQAVFLADGQIYFGKLAIGEEFIELEDIYYLQVQQQVQPGSETPQSEVSLAKLGNELHGPEDKMFINPDQVLFWENLKADGEVTRAITDYVSGAQPEDTGNETPATPAADDTNTGDDTTEGDDSGN